MTDDWVVVEIVETEEEAELVAGYLRSEDVSCQIESIHSHEFPVNVGALGEVRIQVPAGDLSRARRLLAERDASASETSAADD